MATDALYTYGATAARKEDVLDLIYQLTPEETPLLSRLGVTQSRSHVHNWLTDVVNSATASGGATVEGASAVNFPITDRARLTNYTQITTDVIEITGTQEAIAMYGLESEYAYQLEMALKRWKLKVDRILWVSTSATGTSAAVRTLTGVIDAIQSNRQTGSAGSCALTESLYNNLLQTVAENGGGSPNVTFVGGFNKRRISAFSSSNQRTQEVGASGRISNSVDVYQSDFGEQEIVFERYIPKSEGALMQMDTWRLAYLRRPFVQPLAVIGDSKRAEVIGEYTLEYLGQVKNGLLSAFATS